MAKLVRDDAGFNSGRGSTFLKCSAESTNQHVTTALARQQQTARFGCLWWAQRAEPINYLTNHGVHGNPAFGAKFAERYVEDPLVWPKRAQTIQRKIDTFADAHAGVPEQ